MVTEGVIEVGGVRLRALEDGTGEPPIVLLHGLGWSADIWLDAMEHLAPHRRVIALDLPGHGGSDAPDGSYRPSWLAGGVRAWLDANGIGRAVLVGNSLGGLTAATLAATWPERVTGLVLISPALPNDGPPADRARAGWYVAATLPGVGPALNQRLYAKQPEEVVAWRLGNNLVDPSRASDRVREALAADVRRRTSSKDAMRALTRATRATVWAVTGRREATWSVMRSLTVPTLFMWGERDTQVPISVADRALREVPGAHLITLDDLGHTPQVEAPEEFARAVLAFVRATEAEAAAG